MKARSICDVIPLAFGGVARVAATVVTDLAAPDGDKRTGVAVRASPGKDIPVCCLYNDENVTRALVGHFDAM